MDYFFRGQGAGSGANGLVLAIRASPLPEDDKLARSCYAGPVGALLDKAPTAQTPENFNLDFEPLVSYYSSKEAKEDAYETIREFDLRLDGRRVAFSEDWSKLVFLVTEDMVFELNIERMETAVEKNLRDLGFEGFFRALRRKGYSFISEPAANDLRELTVHPTKSD